MSNGDDGSVSVTFLAGFENARDEAPMLIAAVEVGVAALYRDRESPDWSAVNAICDGYRTDLL